MARTTAVRLTGEDLTPDDVWHVAVEDGAAELDDSAREKLAAARAVVEDALRKDEPTYGVTTGFGRFVSTRIPTELAEELQLRLLRSHACGVGEPYPREIVRAAMVMRANTLAKGYSGTRVEVAELLLDCLGRGVVPEVPSRGSVGASGDLAPLAHLALPLVGEGRARFDGELLEGSDALTRAGLQPLRLEAKEGLSLVNGTQVRGAFAALGLVRARRLAKAADGGLNSGFMIPQYVAASLVSENKALSHPASVDSIPTSAGQEDHVSMGNAAGLKAWQVLANAERVVAIELLAGAQAVEFHAPLAPGVGPRAARELVRSVSPRLGDDRSLSDDIEAVAATIRHGSAIAAVEAEAGELQ